MLSSVYCITDYFGWTKPSNKDHLVYDMKNYGHDDIKVLGYRTPNTDIGTWSGVYVCCIDSKNMITMAYFQDGKDFVASSQRQWITWRQCIEEADRCLAKGWTPMTEADITATSGIGRSYVEEKKKYNSAIV